MQLSKITKHSLQCYMGDDVEALCLVMSVENWRGLLGLSLLRISSGGDGVSKQQLKEINLKIAWERVTASKLC